MPQEIEYPKYDLSLTADELIMLDQSLRDTLERLAQRRLILLENGRMESYESAIKQTVDYEILLYKIRRKEL